MAVLGSLASGVVVITGAGQVSLLNTVARELLGAERVRVGTSVFASLDRDALLAAVARARTAGRAVEAVFLRLDGVDLQGRVTPLPDDDGAMLIFPPVELDRHRPGVEFDLELHDVPPVAEALRLDVPLAELPAVILDTETTGLDTDDRPRRLGGGGLRPRHPPVPQPHDRRPGGPGRAHPRPVDHLPRHHRRHGPGRRPRSPRSGATWSAWPATGWSSATTCPST